ncbi:hypothetical protein VKT23_000268 [Stygiomarasmius scandens]|uniref:RRM domain-containing protein n=1 Tax=Marasmiellus scandens TaxID=2682957 RepID=A0ABR1K5H0_9AGAR
MGRVVFVGNVPCNMEEGCLNFTGSTDRLVLDRDTGKLKGYGFCGFAASAVRNLNGYEVGGWPLRIDLADSDPLLEGKTTVRGELVDSGESSSGWRESSSTANSTNAFLANLPPGIPLPPGATASDITNTLLATVKEPEIMDVLAHMKVLERIPSLSTPYSRLYFSTASSANLFSSTCELPLVLALSHPWTLHHQHQPCLNHPFNSNKPKHIHHSPPKALQFNILGHCRMVVWLLELFFPNYGPGMVPTPPPSAGLQGSPPSTSVQATGPSAAGQDASAAISDSQRVSFPPKKLWMLQSRQGNCTSTAGMLKIV